VQVYGGTHDAHIALALDAAATRALFDAAPMLFGALAAGGTTDVETGP